MDCLQALSSLSLESLASVASESSRSVESVRSKSSEAAQATQNAGDGGRNSNAALVGGVVGGVLGAAVLGLIGILVWRRNRAASNPPPVIPPSAPSSAQRPFFSQQPSSQPITPASQTFSMNSTRNGAPPVTYAPQAAWNPQQPAPVTIPAAAGSTAGYSAPGSPAPSYSVNTWIDRPPTINQGNYGGYASQSQSNSFVSR